MIILITGVPGAGKTLYALNWVKAKAEKEGRPVFYSGIKELALPWTELDPEKWFEAPAGALIVIDECQRVFRPRMHGAKVPAYVEQLETHRHQGVDIVLITQHPMLLDSNARRLVGLHFHVVRKFGLNASTVHEWASVKENCDKNRDDSTRHDFVYPKESFTWYKSAEVHTHKARIPARLFVIVGMLALVAAAVWWVVHGFAAKMRGPEVAPAAASSPAGVDPAHAASGVHPAPAGARGRTLSTAEYVEAYRPRIAGLAYTAPAYDKVTEPVQAPYPAACIQSSTRCQCYSQQGTRLEVPAELCKGVAQGGFFVAWDTNGRRVDRPPERAPERTAAASPGASAPVAVAMAGAVSLGGDRPGSVDAILGPSSSVLDSDSGGAGGRHGKAK